MICFDVRRVVVSGALLVVALLSIAVALTSKAYAQSANSIPQGLPTAELHFARLVYENAPESRRAMGGWGNAWSTDYADAEYHMMQGLRRLTSIDGQSVDYGGHGGRLVTLNDDTLFDYPWLYAVEVGQWYLNSAEAKRLREYLDRGGFLIVDDFWGKSEWNVFLASMRRVYSDRPIVDLPDDHPIMNIHYQIVERTQIPGRRGPRPGLLPQWRAILDDEGRVAVAINFNMDMGDAWEHADDPAYPAAMTGLAYRFAMNYVVYSMTH